MRVKDIEDTADKDVVVIMGAIAPNLDVVVRMALEHLEKRRSALLVILDTPGGFVETAERISETLRNFYKTVDFLIPDKAMSAGTVLALSGDAIWMDYFSRLGPIDPQVGGRDGLLPGLSYLRQYESLIKASKEGALTEAELTLLTQLDLAKLHQIDLAASLSVSLIKQWLPRHKFKDWKQGDGTPVAAEKKEERARKIAEALNDHEKWGTHKRGIGMDVLWQDLRLHIDDFSKIPGLKDAVWGYFWAAQEFVRKGEYQFFAHSRSVI